MNTVPTTPTDAERCDVPWCQQPASHLPENHVRVIAVVGPSTWNIVSAVLVTLEAGWGEADPMPVLTLAGKDTANHVVRQTWREATALAASLRPTHYCVSVPAAPLRRPARRSSSSTTPPTTRCGCTRPSAPTSSGCGRW